ncbi:MAG: hypothetical protein ACKKL4_02595 [Patescibacteria group bacterium]
MTNLKNQILTKIKAGEIKQTSRWYFITRDCVFYTLTAITTILGAFAVSSILFQTLREHAPRINHMPHNYYYYKSFIDTMPWFWVGALVLLSFVAWLNYKNTRRAYRHHNLLIIILVLVISFAGGIALFKVGVAKPLEMKFRDSLPLYKMDVERRENLRQRYINQHRMERINFKFQSEREG